MESNRIDEIFKRKLERHSLPVSESAWSQVQSQLPPKKKKKPIVWMLAASVSLLILFTVGIVYNIEDKNSNMADNSIHLQSAQAILNEDVTPVKPQVKEKSSIEAESSADRDKKPAQKVQSPNLMYAANEPVKEEINNVEPLNRVKNLQAAVALNNEVLKLNISTAKPIEEEKTFGIKVEMYYNQQEIAEVKTDNSTNIFNKKANQLRSLASEYSLADLRSAKNELFASAFQNNRKELNN